jgi:ribonuclease HII
MANLFVFISDVHLPKRAGATAHKRHFRHPRDWSTIERMKAAGQCDTHFEEAACQAGYPIVAGIDEVGRGCLFGPVAAAACVLDLGRLPSGINDSKKLTAKQRTKLADEIRKAARDYAIAFIEASVVDQINILEATREAMRRAVAGLKEAPAFLLCDGIYIPGIQIPQQNIVHGDALSVSIAAASILAKVERDQLIDRLAVQFPGYDLENNKGYGTARHLEALRRRGPTELHRLTFKGVLQPEALA